MPYASIATTRLVKDQTGNWRSNYWPEMLAVAVSLIFGVFYLDVVPSPDVAWQLWIAHQVRMGARLYVDIIETNPPLWFWEAVPVDWISELFKISSHVTLVTVTCIATTLSVWGTGRLISHIPPLRRAALLIYATLALLLIPLVDMGQREQIVLIGALPYAALASARREGRRVPYSGAIAIAVGASLGLALKHYFLIAPLLLELWLLIGRRRTYNPFRPETIALIVLAMIYIGVMVTVTPAYFSTMLEINRVAYATIVSATLSDMFRPIQAYWLIGLLIIIVEFGALRRSPLAAAMAVMTLGFCIAWLIQYRGFPYHSIPVSGCLVMTLAYLAADGGGRMRILTLVTMPTVLLIPLAFTAWHGPYKDEFRSISDSMIADVGRHEVVAFVNYEAVFAWPLSLYRTAPYPSRQYGMWILRTVADDHSRNAALRRIGQKVVTQTTQDYRCSQPVRIIFSRRLSGGRDVKSWFDESSEFHRLMAHYHYVRTNLIFDIYRLNAPFPKPSSAECRRSFSNPATAKANSQSVSGTVGP